MRGTTLWSSNQEVWLTIRSNMAPESVRSVTCSANIIPTGSVESIEWRLLKTEKRPEKQVMRGHNIVADG